MHEYYRKGVVIDSDFYSSRGYDGVVVDSTVAGVVTYLCGHERVGPLS